MSEGSRKVRRQKSEGWKLAAGGWKLGGWRRADAESRRWDRLRLLAAAACARTAKVKHAAGRRPRRPLVQVLPAPARVDALRAAGGPFAADGGRRGVRPTPPASDRGLAGRLVRRGTGLAVPVRIGSAGRARDRFRPRDRSGVADGDEGYDLTIASSGATLTGANPGRPLLRRADDPSAAAVPRRIRSGDVPAAAAVTLPAVHIVDAPRYAWRGAMLDVARHFFPPDDIKRYIDLLALHKINRLHLHLADDQGWRIEIKSRPRLTEIGGGIGGGRRTRRVLHAGAVRRSRRLRR